MENLNLAGSPGRPEMGVLAQRASACCDMMGVAYVARMTDTAEQRSRDRIQILIPGEQAVLHAAYHTADGREQTIHVRGHQVTVIPAREPHAVHSAQPGDRPVDVIIIALDPAFYEQKVREALGAGAPTLIGLHAAMDPFMSEVGNTLRGELRNQLTPPRTYLESLAIVIAIHLARHYCNDAAASHVRAGLPPHKLARVQAYIQEHLEEALRVQQLASAVHMSTFHFARMFKQATGQPPHVYLTLQRIEHAKRLLRDGRLSLIEVAARTGFQTQGHFTGVFHRYTGTTPRIFRLSSRAVLMHG